MTPRQRVFPAHRSLFVERAAITWRAFETIDKRYPFPKWADENNHWTREVREILSHEKMTDQDKIDALLTLIGRVTTK